MSLDLTHIIVTVQSTHPEFSYEEIEAIAQDFLASRKKDKKKTTKIKSLKKYFAQEFEVDMSVIDDETGWQIATMHEVDQKAREERKLSSKTSTLDKLPVQHFQGKPQKRTDCLARFEKVGKTMGTKQIFDDADFQINGCQKVALIGRNGIGKSTLLRILIEREPINDGEIKKIPDLKIGYISQELFWESADHTLEQEIHTSDPELCELMTQYFASKDSVDHHVMENIQRMDGFKRWDLQVELLKYFGFSHDDLGRKISELSGGQQVRVQLAKCLLQEVDLLVLDEPTNHLDIEGIEFLETFCQMWNRAMICISHDRRFIEEVFDTILEISARKIRVFSGDYQKFIDHKALEHESQMRKYEAQQEYLEKQQKFINKFRYKASSAGAVQSRIKQLEKLEILEKPQMDVVPDEVSLPELDIRMPSYLLRTQGLQIGRGDVMLVDLPHEIEILGGQKIGVLGANGVGKTTLVETLVGNLKPYAGSIEINEKIRIGYLSQSADELDPDATVLQSVQFGKVSRAIAQGLLASLLITSETVNQKISTLSGGERVKVALARMILKKPHMIFMDEPTNHLDIVTKEVLKKMLEKFPGSIILVSHDRDFLGSLCDTFWRIEDHQMVISFN